MPMNRAKFCLQSSHGGVALNDNLDGTFTLLSQDNGDAVPVVVSRNPMDVEDIAEPSYPTYPYGGGKHVLWVKVRSAEQSRASRPKRNLRDTRSMTSAKAEPEVAASGDGFTVTTDGRRYDQWFGKMSCAIEAFPLGRCSC